MPIDIKTFLLGTSPKNTQLTIEEMDQNFINLKNGIENLDLNLTNSITVGIATEQAERIAADNAETVSRISADALLNSRLTAVEGSFLKKDGSIAMTGILNSNGFKIINVAKPTGVSDVSPKGYVDREAPYYASTVEVTSNLTLVSSDFPAVSNSLYYLSTTATSSRVLTLPAPNSVPVGTRIHVANLHTLSSRNITISSTTLSMRYMEGGIGSSQIIHSGGRVIVVTDGTYWNLYKPVHKPITSNMWNDGVVTVRPEGDSYLGKSINLKSTNTNGYIPSSVDFSIQTTGSELKIYPDATGTSTSVLSIDRASGKIIQNTNAPVTEYNQLVTRDYIDKSVSATYGIINKVIPIANIKQARDVPKPDYPTLDASDFGNIVRYRMEGRGVVLTRLPEISTLSGSKRIQLINISNDTLPSNSGIVPAYAPYATINIFPSGTNKIVGQGGSVFTVNGVVSLGAGDNVELLAVSGNEWMVISHSSLLSGGREAIHPHNRIMIMCGINANGTVATYTVGSSTRSYLWTKPNILHGSESGIIVATSRITTGTYAINWLNPNCWEAGQSYIVAPTANVTVNFAGDDTSGESYNTKVDLLPSAANGCRVTIKNHNNTLRDAPFVIVVYGEDV